MMGHITEAGRQRALQHRIDSGATISPQASKKLVVLLKDMLTSKYGGNIDWLAKDLGVTNTMTRFVLSGERRGSLKIVDTALRLSGKPYRETLVDMVGETLAQLAITAKKEGRPLDKLGPRGRIVSSKKDVEEPGPVRHIPPPLPSLPTFDFNAKPPPKTQPVLDPAPAAAKAPAYVYDTLPIPTEIAKPGGAAAPAPASVKPAAPPAPVPAVAPAPPPAPAPAVQAVLPVTPPANATNVTPIRKKTMATDDKDAKIARLQQRVRELKDEVARLTLLVARDMVKQRLAKESEEDEDLLGVG